MAASSPELSKALIEELVAGGADVITIGMGPTPMLYFADIMLDCERYPNYRLS